MPELLRDVYILSEVENLEYAEIADVLQIPIGTVKSKMFNAVRNLRKELTKVLSHEVS